MSTHTHIPINAPVIVMTRFYPAPRPLVWRALTQPQHVQRWWGGAGCTSPVCEMDARPGGSWRHVMRTPEGREVLLEFVFVEVAPPRRLVWQHADHGQRRDGSPTARMEVILDEIGAETRWTLLMRFNSMAERDAGLARGFTSPIEASSELLTSYLEELGRAIRASAAPATLPPWASESAPSAWLHTLSVGSFVPMLQSLQGWLERAAAHTAALPQAPPAPDAQALAEQVQLACHHARDTVERLLGAGPSAPAEAPCDPARTNEQLAETLGQLRSVPRSALAGAAERDCTLFTADGRVMPMDGFTFLRAWALPQFYFHVVTAYDILRRAGVPLGEQDYLSQLGALLRPPPA